MLHNIDPIRKFAAIRVDQYKLVVNQDSAFRTTWHPRYAVVGELGTTAQADTLPGAVVDCGPQNMYQTMDCDTDVFPCLFDISKGNYEVIFSVFSSYVYIFYTTWVARGPINKINQSDYFISTNLTSTKTPAIRIMCL